MAISSIVKRFFPRFKDQPKTIGSSSVSLIPLQGLTPLANDASPTLWRSHSDDPQFYLNPRFPNLLAKPGWLVLEYDFDADEPSFHQLYLDLGQGYEADVVVSKAVTDVGRVRFVCYSPGGVRGLRLDPSTGVLMFSIDNVTIEHLDHLSEGLEDDAPSLTDYFRHTQPGSGIFLKPVNQISRSISDRYHWLSDGLDPYFMVMADEGELLSCPPGWYEVNLHMDFADDTALARLFFMTDGDFTEQGSIAIIVCRDEPCRRMVFLPNGAEMLRLDPMEKKGPFRVNLLSFSGISLDEAIDSCLEKLCESGSEYEGLTKDKCRERIETESLELGVSFDEALNLRYQESFEQLEYNEWIKAVEEPSLPSDMEVEARLAALSATPLISIILPVYNPGSEWLTACIDSVLRQSYPHWQLCIADDASTLSHVRSILEGYSCKDERICVAFRESNGHISEASNTALDLVDGDYVALMDHDDELPPHALLFVAEAICESPEVKVLYTDEDKIDEKGRRFDPHFKSAWNPELFFAQNYVSHLGVYRTYLLQKVGGFRKGVEGSQDQDLLLRCLPFISDNEIVHIPRVLYHWRSIDGSTAMSSGEKSYTTDAGLKALRDYFADNGPDGTEIEEGLVANTYRVKWPLPDPKPLVSLLIPTRDRRELVEVAVRSILEKTTYGDYEILILDNGSVEPGTLEFFASIQKEDSRVRVERYDHPFNYSAINNFGVSKCSGSIVGLINNDVEVISPDWLSEMVRHACRPGVGCVGAKLYYGNDQIQHAGVIVGLGGVAGHSHKYFDKNDTGYFHRLVVPQNLSAVTAACLLVRRSVYEEVGGLDEENLTVAFNDVDFCLKVFSAGYRNVWTPYAELYHHESISRGTEDSPEKIKRFQGEIEYMRSRWGEILDSDPFYSRNLTIDREDFSIGR